MEIKQITAAAFKDQATQRKQIYSIINKVKRGGDAPDQRGKNKEKKRSGPTLSTLIADIADGSWERWLWNLMLALVCHVIPFRRFCMKIFDYKKSMQDGSLKFILILLLSSAIGLPPLLSRSQKTSPIHRNRWWHTSFCSPMWKRPKLGALWQPPALNLPGLGSPPPPPKKLMSPCSGSSLSAVFRPSS